MPAGVGWSEYFKFFTCAMLSMMAGSQLVHAYYKPLEDLKQYIEREEQALAAGQKTKVEPKKA